MKIKGENTTLYERIIKAQSENKSEITYIDEDGKEVKMILIPTNWIEGMLKY